MVKRKLLSDEKKFTLKNIDRNKEELSHLKLLVESYEFMLDKMLYSNYLEKVRGYKKAQKGLKEEVVILEEVIGIGEDQIKNGVEAKNKIPIGVN